VGVGVGVGAAAAAAAASGLGESTSKLDEDEAAAGVRGMRRLGCDCADEPVKPAMGCCEGVAGCGAGDMAQGAMDACWSGCAGTSGVLSVWRIS